MFCNGHGSEYMLGTLLGHLRDSYVHSSWSPGKPDIIDSSSRSSGNIRLPISMVWQWDVVTHGHAWPFPKLMGFVCHIVIFLGGVSILGAPILGNSQFWLEH